jgi:ABC-2 type transport system ATP-binding protein
MPLWLRLCEAASSWSTRNEGRLETSRVNGSRYAVETDGLSKSYGKHVALRNLSLRVPERSVYGLIGPRHAGKTTTLRTLATLERFEKGSARVSGFELPTNSSAVRDRVAFMPEAFGTYGDLSVGEYLDFYGQGYGIVAPARRRLRDDLLELMDLTESRQSSVDSLPSATKQRLSLARCLIHDPDVLLLDEPMAGLDPVTRSDLGEIMAELARLGKTILLTGEDASQVADTCSHVGIIEDGELVREGPVRSTLLAGIAADGISVAGFESDDQASDDGRIHESEAAGSDS